MSLVVAVVEDDTVYPRPAYAWVVVLILVATAILSYTDRQVLSLLVDPIRADLHIDDTQISLLLGTAFALVYGVAGVPIGLLADRLSRRNLIAAGILVWSVGTICCGLSQNFGQLFASRILVGLGEAALSPAAISLISDYFPPARRGAAVGLFLAGIAIGIGLAILIGGGILQAVQSQAFQGTPLASVPAWRLVLLLIGSPGIAWTALIFVIREPLRRGAPRAVGPVSAPAAPEHKPRSLWFRVAPVYAVVAIASLVDNAVGAWAPTLLIRHFGLPSARVGIELGILLAFGYGGGVLGGGFLADKAGAMGGWFYKLGVCLACSVLIVATTPILAAATSGTVLLGIPLYFALSGAVTAAGFAAILDVVPSQDRGFAMAVSFLLNVAIGGSVGPIAVVAIAGHVRGNLGSAISLTVAGFYLMSVAVLCVTGLAARKRGRAATLVAQP